MSYSVYVIELESHESDQNLPAVYVGITGRTVEERFQQHKDGYKSSRDVKDRGVRLLPDLFPRPTGGFEIRREAEEMEREWAETLRSRGYAVYGGH
jgi:predicted GIY-YIG superfamily endonuclease